MKFDWLGIAEAAVVDARGALILIGVNQNVALTPKVPSDVKRAIVVYVTDEEEELTPGSMLHFKLSADSPYGQELTAINGNIVVQGKMFPELPGALQFALELSMHVTEFGRYLIRCRVDGPNGKSIEAERELWVREAKEREPQLVSPPSNPLF